MNHIAESVLRNMGVNVRCGATALFSDLQLEDMGSHAEHMIKGTLARYFANGLADIVSYKKFQNNYTNETEFRFEAVLFTPEQFATFCREFEMSVRRNEWEFYEKIEIKAKELSQLEAKQPIQHTEASEEAGPAEASAEAEGSGGTETN